MTRGRRILLWGAASAGVAALAALAALALLPRWIDTPALRARLEAEASRALGAQVRVGAIALSILPPLLVLREPSVSGHGALALRAEALTAVPRLLPLLRGELVLVSLGLEAPHLAVSLPPSTATPGPAPSPLARLEQAAAALAGAAGVRPVRLTVARGEVVLSRPDGPALHFREVEARLQGDGPRTRVEVSGGADGGAAFSLAGWVEPETLAGEAEVAVTGASPGDLLPRTAPGTADLEGTRADLSLSWASPGGGSGTASWAVRLHPLVVTVGGGRRSTAADLAGTLVYSPAEVSVDVRRLSLADPPVRGSAVAEWRAAGPEVRAALRVPEGEIAPLREAAMALFGSRRWVRTLFEILRAGTVADLEVAGRAPSWDALGRLEHLEVRGTLDAGVLRPPAVGLEVTGGRGTVALAQGVLRAAGLGGTAGDSAVRGGELTLGLRGPSAPFLLALDLDADLADLPAVLRRTVSHPTFLRHLDRVEDPRGRARGRLRVGERLGALAVSAEIEQVEASGRYRTVPLPLSVTGGSLSLAPSRLDARGLAGAVGRSAFAGLDGGVAWAGAPRLHVASGTARADLGELYPWLAPLLAGDGARRLEGVAGTASLDRVSVEGPALEPGSWVVDLRGRLPGAAATAAGLGRVGIDRADLEVTADTVSFRNAAGRFADAALRGEGAWRFRGTGPAFAAAGGGDLGPEAVRALQDLLPMPAALRLRGPLSLAGARLEWAGAGTGTFTGSLTAGPAALELDTAWAPGTFALRRLGIRDSGTTAAADLRADLGEDALEFGFRGVLGGATLDRVLEHPGLLSGSVSGDLRLRLPQGRMGKAIAEGRLRIEGLELPGELPVRVEAADLEASGSELRARSARVLLGSAEVGLRGTARVSPQAVGLDLDASAPTLDLEELRPLLGARGEGGGLRALGLPLRGTVRVQADALAWAGRTWKTVRAKVGLGPEGIDLDVAAADLCGVATPGTLSLRNRRVRLRAAPAAQGLSVAPALACLWGVEGLATGTASLQAEVGTEGDPERLLSSTQGEFRFSAADGRVRRYDLLARIFALLNVTEVFRGNLPDLAGEGLGYRALRADGTLRGGVLEFREGVMDASSVTLFWRGTWDLTRDALDLTVLVAPFKTADAVVKRLPVLGYVLGDSLVAVPVRVTGRRTEPQVVPLDPSAVGAGLLGVVKRTLSLPLRVIQPLLESERK